MDCYRMNQFVKKDLIPPHRLALYFGVAAITGMRMVAVDEFNLRLDLDYNGDGVVDDTIPTSYATLGYDDFICE